MDFKTARILNEVTSRFYREQAESFSATRHAGWPGWSRALACVETAGVPQDVLDVACGNMRFERFLDEQFPESRFLVWAVDNCAPLAGEVPGCVDFRELDVMECLFAGNLPERLPEKSFDLVVCFGFMHHVPGRENRVQLLRALAGKVKPGGHLVVSFWGFMNSPELAEKAREAHARGLRALRDAGLDPAQLDEVDFLLGWQHEQNAFRYCHHFTQGEVERLVEEAGLNAQVADLFQSDGRTANLNTYLVIRGK